jgi:hypothetical protein
VTESDEAPKSLRDLALTITAGVTKAMGDINRLNVADVGLAAATVQGAAVLALVHVSDQIRAQVEVQRQQLEQQKLANVIAAFQAGIDKERHWLEVGYDDKAAAADYVRARIGDIVNPRPESETKPDVQ